jgi:hypothetical protein
MRAVGEALRLSGLGLLVGMPATIAWHLTPITEIEQAQSAKSLGTLTVYASGEEERPVVRSPDVNLLRKSYGFDLMLNYHKYPHGRPSPDTFVVARGVIADALAACDVTTYVRPPSTSGSLLPEPLVTDHGRLDGTLLPFQATEDAQSGRGEQYAVRLPLDSSEASAMSAKLTCRTPRGLVARDAGGDLYFYVPNLEVTAVGYRDPEQSGSLRCLRVTAGDLSPDATVEFEDPEANSVDGPLRTWASCREGPDGDDAFQGPITAQYHSNDGERQAEQSLFIAGALVGLAGGALVPAFEAVHAFIRALRPAGPQPPTALTTHVQPPSRGAGSVVWISAVAALAYLLGRRRRRE